jgi:hypothetical protein
MLIIITKYLEEQTLLNRIRKLLGLQDPDPSINKQTIVACYL